MLLLCVIPLCSQPTIENLLPRDARSMALGGSSILFAEGGTALWANPAGLARKKSFTLLDSSTWAYFRPTPANISSAITMINQGASSTQIAASVDQAIAENDFGAGESLVFGYTSDGIGLGITYVADAFASGTGLSDAKLLAKSQLNAVLGMAWMIDLGSVKFDFGANVRGYYRIENAPSGWNFDPLVQSALGGSNLFSALYPNKVRGGFGVSVDAGAVFAIGPFALGFMVRDIAEKIALNESTVEGIAQSYMVPSGGLDYYSIAPQYTVGLSVEIHKGSLLATSLFFEADDPLSLVKIIANDFQSLSSILHSGVEIEALRFLSFRAGLNHGYISFGAGVHILFLEVNAAVFSDPVSADGTTRARSGIVAQASIKF